MNEGWATDIAQRGGKEHYYKDGKSLCRRAVEKKYFRVFDKSKGSIYFEQCAICVKKQQELNNK